LGSAGQFAPGNELDVLLLKQLPEFLAGEEIEIALAPGGAPGIAFARSGFHFFIGEGDVDDEFRDTGLEIFEGRLVEVSPPFGRDGG